MPPLMSRLGAWLGPNAGTPQADTSPASHAPCTLRGQRLEGWLRWPADPFYRPLVGVFLDRQLRYIVPSRRRPGANAERKDWRCAFAADIGILAAHDPSRLAVLCLETGAPVGVLGSPVATAPDEWGVPEVIAFAEGQQPAWDCTGFARFLDLSVPDQIDLLYRDILGRGADPYGAGSFLHGIISGRLTILDVRDQLVFSGEFQQDRQASVARQLGQWCVWGGIQDIVPIIMPNPLPGGADRETDLVSSLELVARRQKLGDYLARVALGNAPSSALVRQWQHDHSVPIAALEALAAERQAARRPRPLAQPLARPLAQTYPMHFGELLGSMRIGAAGSRVADRILSQKGAKGLVVRGPYMRLPAGAYRLEMRMHGTWPATAAPRVWIEVCRSIAVPAPNALIPFLRLHAVMMSLPLGPDDRGKALHSIAFDWPASPTRLLSEQRFALRVRSDGVADLEIESVTLERVGPSSVQPASVQPASVRPASGQPASIDWRATLRSLYLPFWWRMRSLW